MGRPSPNLERLALKHAVELLGYSFEGFGANHVRDVVPHDVGWREIEPIAIAGVNVPIHQAAVDVASQHRQRVEERPKQLTAGAWVRKARI